MSGLYISFQDNVTSEEFCAFWEEIGASEPVTIDLTKVLELLPELEAEVLWLLFEKKKSQKDIAELLEVPPSTISYRSRRAMQKLEYLVQLTSINVVQMVACYDFLTLKEKAILVTLFYTANQDLTGRRHGCRQSTTKWIFTKTRRKIEILERNDPTMWFNHFGLLLLLEQNLGIRVV